MPYLGLNNIDDFLETVKPKYVLTQWKDISMNLQEYYFASRLFSKAAPESMESDHVEWRVQVANNETFKFTGLFADDTTVRTDLMTHAEMGWSMSSANYIYDINEDIFRTSAVRIIEYMRTLEHSMYNSYFEGMERAMFSGGPTSPTQTEPPPASLLWWLQPYNGNASQLSTTYGTALTAGSATSSNFLGMDPSGFESVGTAKLSRATNAGWRNRCGVYTVVSQDDLIDTAIECIRKCKFKPAHQYAELAPGSRPKWECLTTYSRIKEFDRILAASNDNIVGDVGTYKAGVPMIVGVPIEWIPAWSNQDFGTARTDGVFLGVNWSTFKWYSAAGRRMVRRPPWQDPHKSDVRWVKISDSGQLVCQDCRQNFNLTLTSGVTATESN
jgi:hypothetical protein